MLYSIHTNCVIEKGYKNSVILDLYRNRYLLIPNEYSYYLLKYIGVEFNLIKQELCDLYDSFLSYLNFLEKDDYIFFKDDVSSTPYPLWKTTIHENSIDYAEIRYSRETNFELIDKMLKEFNVKNILIDFNFASCNLIQFVNELNNNDIFVYSNYIAILCKSLVINNELIDSFHKNNRISEIYLTEGIEQYNNRLDHINIFKIADKHICSSRLFVHGEYYNYRKNKVQPNKFIIDEKNNIFVTPMHDVLSNN